MLKRTASLFIFNILVGRMPAQSGFYIKPFLEQAVVINHSPAFNLTLNNHDGLPITIRPLKVIPLSSIDLGCYFGYQFNNRWGVEAGIVRMSTESGCSIDAYEFKPASGHYTNYRAYFYAGVLATKVPLRANWTLIRLDSLRNSKYSYHLDLNFGIDLLFAPKGDPDKVLIGEENFIIPRDTLRYTQVNEEMSSENSFGLLNTVGLTFKIRRKDGSNLINFTCLYSSGRIAISKEIISVYHPGMPKMAFYLPGTGTGMYYSVSTELNFKQLKKRREHRLKKKFETENSRGNLK